MSEVIDIQDAFDELSKQHAELVFAFYGFAALVSGFITKGTPFDAETLAGEYEHLAEQAGQQLASVGGEAPERNTHLQSLADNIRNLRKPIALTAIDGGKGDRQDNAP